MVGVDINPGMLQVAATRSVSVLPAIQWRQASADDLPFPQAAFDVVVCQQGLQFVPDLQAAVTEAARVNPQGWPCGRYRVVAAGTVALLQAQFRAVEEVIGAQASAPFTDAFGCSPDRVTAAFRAAGLGEVEAREVVADIRLPSIVEFVAGHLTRVPQLVSM